MLRREGLQLDLRNLEYLAHWVTPVGSPRRYDTRFFVVLAPANQIATHDAGETVADRWLSTQRSPRRLRARRVRDDSPDGTEPPGGRDFAEARDVLEHARGLDDIVCIEPRIIDRDGTLAIVTPGDEGFDD